MKKFTPRGKYKDYVEEWHLQMLLGISAAKIAKKYKKMNRNKIIGAVWRYRTGRTG